MSLPVLSGLPQCSRRPQTPTLKLLDWQIPKTAPKGEDNWLTVQLLASDSSQQLSPTASAGPLLVDGRGPPEPSPPEASMARGEREAGWEEAGDGAVRGTGGSELSRQQPRCQRGRRA